jgi:Flp pilus assembly protein TadD
MKGYAVQIIVFFFSGTILFTGIYLVIGGGVENTPISIVITIFTVSLLLIIIAAVNPYEILELKYGKFHLKRHQPAQEEREEAIKMAADNPVEISAEEKERLIKAAERRTDEVRSPEDYLILATEAWREEKHDIALEFAFTGLNLKPEDTKVKATLIHRIGSVYDNLEIPDLAIKYYKEAMEKDPKFSWPHNNLGLLYYEQKKYAEAEKECEKAIELDPENAMPHNNLGLIYDKQKKYVEAEKKYNKAIGLDPENALAHNNLGALYYEQKKYADAEDEYKKAIELDPDLELARENLKILQSLIKNKGRR